jgi:hypothetical protein
VNHLLSLIGTFIIYIQPIAALFLLKNTRKRNQLLSIYLLSLPLLIYKLVNNSHMIMSKISNKGHLEWHWPNMGILGIMYILFLFYPMILSKHYGISFATFCLLILSIYSYGEDNSYKSMWCWYANIFMIVFVFKLLVYLPYKEHYNL